MQSQFRQGRGGFGGQLWGKHRTICAVSEVLYAVLKALKLVGRDEYFHEGWAFLETRCEANQLVLLKNGKD